MKENELIDLKKRFSVYAASYKNGNKNFSEVILLKEEHTFRVCNEIKNLCISINLSAEETRLAETIALLHDLGRFEQYKKYGTFSDFNSENHEFLPFRFKNRYSLTSLQVILRDKPPDLMPTALT